MNHYETVTLLVPEFSDKDIQKYIDELRALLTEHGATDLAPPRVDRRALAYPIGKSTEGYYVYLQCDAPPTLPEVIRTELKHREGILRLAFIRRPKVAPETENAERPAPAVVTDDGPDDSPDAADDAAPERDDG